MPRLALAAFALALLSSTAHAGPITFVEQRKNFMVFDDDGTVEHANWFSRTGFYNGYYPLEQGFLAAHPDDGQFIVVYSTFDLVDGVGAFYQSLANDVAGIGYSHAAEFDPVIPAEFFDDTPDSQFIGMLHMNNWKKFVNVGTTEINDWWISLVFGQELGHAWLAFPYINQGGGTDKALLGRSDAHWNFYMHTNGSPVEGHRWTDNNDGTFTADKLETFEFSDLDLYLMGLMHPKEVQPWFVIDDPHDCVDSELPDQECPKPSSFLFKSDTFTVSGTRREITIDDVILAEGERVPAYPDAPNEFGLSFLLIKRPDEVLCEEEYAIIDEVIDRSIDMWVGQTRGRANIINRTHSDAPIRPGMFCETGTSETGDDTGPATTDAPHDPTTGSSGSATASSTTATSSSTGTTAEPDSDSGTGGSNTPDTGCGCRSSSGGPTSIALLLGLAGLARRRRRT